MREEAKFFEPEGQFIHSFARDKEKGSHYEIYKMEVCDKNFKTHNHRLQAILPFYIEGASFIQNEPSWSYYLLYKVTKQLSRVSWNNKIV